MFHGPLLVLLKSRGTLRANPRDREKLGILVEIFNMAASISLIDAKESLKKYLPYGGLAGYSILALHSVKVHPEELIIGKDSRAVVFHGALVLSGIGMGTYLFTRPVFDVMQAPKSKRVLWSLFGSWMFNFGSLLLWAICKEICPKNKLARAVIVLSSCGGLVYIARDYLRAVDALRWGIMAEREGGQDFQEGEGGLGFQVREGGEEL